MYHALRQLAKERTSAALGAGPRRWLEALEWPARLAHAASQVIATGVPGFFLAPTAAGGVGPWLVPGLAAAALVAWGTWRWLREAGASGLAPLVVLATFAQTVIFHAGYVHYLPTLPTRLLLPVAPLLWIAAAKGAADVAARSGLAAADGRRLAAAAMAACLVALGAAHVAAPPGGLAARVAVARRHHALFAAVRREVPAGRPVLSQFHAMTWLYTGRPGYAIPPDPADGRLRPIAPLAFLMVLEHWRIGHVVVQPAADGGVGAAVGAFEAAFPGVLEPRWAADGARVLRVAPGPFAAACAAHRIRERNAAFEAGGR